MFDFATLEAIKKHAMAEYPKESCGVVMADGYHPLLNHSPTPEEAFECTTQIAPLLAAERVLALVHSHPDGPDHPTDYDMKQQVVMDIPWGICACTATAALAPFFWHDDFDPPPLLGRNFRWGPSGTDNRGDCAALVRDYYRLNHGVRLKEFHRDDRWWTVPGASYHANLLAAGFVPIDPRYVEVGDVFLAAIRSSSPNHAGIYIGNGRIMHHLTNRLSREDSSSAWVRMMTGWYRHAPD